MPPDERTPVMTVIKRVEATLFTEPEDGKAYAKSVVLYDNASFLFGFTEEQMQAFASGAWWALKATLGNVSELTVLVIDREGLDVAIYTLVPGSWGGPDMVA
jgi:hypothetical protein